MLGNAASGQRITAFVSWSHASNAGAAAAPGTAARADADKAWEREVYDLVTTLRAKGGIDAIVDLANESDHTDWTRFGPTLIRERDVTLVAVNAAWRRAWEGSGPADVGAGAASETDELHGLFNRDREAFQRRVKLILLPGSDQTDLPPGLDRIPRYIVSTIDSAGIEPLLRALTSQPRLPLVELGPVPLLPAETAKAIDRDAPAAVDSESDRPRDPAPTAAPPSAGAATRAAPLAAEIAFLESALRQLPAQGAITERDEPRAREWGQMRRQLVQLRNQIVHQQPAPPRAETTITERRAAVRRLDDLLDTVTSALDRTNRCWVVVAVAPVVGYIDRRGLDTDAAESPRERVRGQLERWKERVQPAVAVDTFTALRRPGRVVFPGEPLASDGADRSLSRRIELFDDARGVAASDVAGQACLQPDTGTPIPEGQSDTGKLFLDGELYLPVRQDRLEVWLLTELELLIEHLLIDGGDLKASVSISCRLVFPETLSDTKVIHASARGVRVVREYRDADGRRVDDVSAPGATDLPLGTTPPAAGPVTIFLRQLTSAAGLVRVARQLAVGLLEQMGVEQTIVLRADGTLDAFAAAAADQQLVHQHAAKLGLPVDALSPMERRTRYQAMLDAARRQLSP